MRPRVTPPDVSGDGLHFGAHLLGTTLLLAALLLGATALLAYWAIEDVAEDLRTTMLERATVRLFQLELALEEVVLTSQARDLSAVLTGAPVLEEAVSAVRDADAAYLYCLVQSPDGRVLWQGLDGRPPAAALALPPGFEETTGPYVEAFSPPVSGPARTVYQLAIPVSIRGEYLGALKLGVSDQALSVQTDRIAEGLIRKHLLGFLFIAAAIVVAGLQTVRLLRRRRRWERRIRETDRLIVMGTIAGGLAHELRNPLNAMHVDSQLLAEEAQAGGGSEDLVRLARRIGESVQHLDDTLAGFLRMSKPVHLLRETVQLGQLVKEAIDLVVRDLGRAGILVEWEKPERPVTVWADPTQLRQAVLNLLINAQQAVPEGGVVSVGVEASGGRAGIRVSDTGPGVPEGEREKVFNLFQSTKPSGTGMGLPIARRIVEAHGGRIEVDQAAGGGARFTIWLDTTNPQDRG
jgi:signal transduction histidine kinase